MSPDAVDQPLHYVSHPSGIECITITKHMSFCLGNVVKYVWRADLKGEALEDLLKARTYLNYEIAKREADVEPRCEDCNVPVYPGFRHFAGCSRGPYGAS